MILLVADDKYFVSNAFHVHHEESSEKYHFASWHLGYFLDCKISFTAGLNLIFISYDWNVTSNLLLFVEKNE
jgi:hypothetical protein